MKAQGAELAIRFNKAIMEQFGGKEPTTNAIIEAAGAVLAGYIKQVDDVEYKRKRFKQLFLFLQEEWGV